MNKIKRYVLFLVGLFINALGVSLVTKANLGTSPISSIPYVLSLNFPLTLGNFTIIFSILLILLQILILRKNFKLENILQIPVSIAFGYFIDLTMSMLAWLKPEMYALKVVALFAGCIILGFGVYLEVLADVVMLPGESFVRAIVQTWSTNFGTTKIIFDSSMTVIAGVLSFIFFGKLNGVREGTIIAALLVGFIARLFSKHLEFIKPYIFPEDYKKGEEKAKESTELQHKNVIVIGRCSDYILKDNKNALKLFFTAPIESRVGRISKRLEIEHNEAMRKIRKEDKLRADNYRYYTGRIWGRAANYDITINTDMGVDYIEKCVTAALSM